jgi:hypothetical protein
MIKWQDFASGKLWRQGGLFLVHFLLFFAWQVRPPAHVGRHA